MSEGIGFAKQKLIESIIRTNFGVEPHQRTFNFNELLFILQETLHEEGKQYLEPPTDKFGYVRFRKFVQHLMYRNIANYDTMLLCTGEKGSSKSSVAMIIAKYWCSLLGIKFDPKRHIAYNNADVMRKIKELRPFEPIICLAGNTMIKIKINNKIKNVKISSLVGKKFKSLSYDIKSDKFELKQVDKCVISGTDYTYNIRLENGQIIKATKNHMFLTKNGEYKKLSELELLDELVIFSKKCVICNKEFAPIKGLQICCSKKCSKQRDKDVYLKQRDRYLRYHKEYRKKNKEELKIKRDIKYKKNKDVILERKKQERIRNKKSYIIYRKKYWKKNKKILSEKNKTWRKNNRELINYSVRKRHKRLMKESPEYKITKNLRRRLNLALKAVGANKYSNTWELTGCDIHQLKKHIERQFKDGMSWNNYGSYWDIDHIIPCASFDLINPEEQQKCFHWTNQQPLKKLDNTKKGAKIDNL